MCVSNDVRAHGPPNGRSASFDADLEPSGSASLDRTRCSNLGILLDLRVSSHSKALVPQLGTFSFRACQRASKTKAKTVATTAPNEHARHPSKAI